MVGNPIGEEMIDQIYDLIQELRRSIIADGMGEDYKDSLTLLNELEGSLGLAIINILSSNNRP